MRTRVCVHICVCKGERERELNRKNDRDRERPKVTETEIVTAKKCLCAHARIMAYVVNDQCVLVCSITQR